MILTKKAELEDLLSRCYEGAGARSIVVTVVANKRRVTSPVLVEGNVELDHNTGWVMF